MQAFRSTLEEAALADVLIIVSDGASPEMLQQHETVEAVLRELGATEQPRIEAVNKCDLGATFPAFPGAVLISAATGEGLPELTDRIARELQKTHSPVTVTLPFSRYGELSQIRQLGRVIDESYTEDGACLTMILSAADRERIAARFGPEVLRGAGKE